MPPIARGNGVDIVFSKTGSGRKCPSPLTTATAACSDNVFANETGVVRQGDAVAAHPAAGCSNDASTLSSASASVFANGSPVGRIGDEYTSDNIITSGSDSVFSG